MSIRRKTSMRDAYAAKQKDKGIFFSTLQRAFLKRGKPIKKVSRSRRTKLEKYRTLRAGFLNREPHCQCCPILGINPPNRSTECHHAQGRAGSLFLDVTTWIAVCGTCHQQIHASPAWAREKGLLAPSADWNRPKTIYAKA